MIGRTMKSAALRRIASCEDGLAALEFALLAPLLMAILFGIVTYSLYFSAVLGVRHAAARGLARPWRV